MPGTRDCVTNYNNIRSVPIVTEKGIAPQSNNPTSWDAVIINEDDLMLHFQIDDLNGIPFRGVSESLVEARTNKYACVVSALYAVSMHYGLTSSNANQFNPDYYKEIWNVTGTTTYKTNDQGVEYGSTIIPDGIVPFKSLAAQKVEHLILNFSVISLNSLSTEQLSIKGISACIICGSTAETVKDPSSYQVIQSR